MGDPVDEATGREEALRRELERMRTELRELNRIGMALMSERDPERLLGMILTQARRLSASDAGSLYLVESDENGVERLRFLRAQNDSIPELTAPDFTLPLDDSSVAGYVALRGEPVVLEDVYAIPAELPFAFNRTVFDERYGYRAKSMLTAPMIDHRGRVVGVLQLINRVSGAGAPIRTDDEAARRVLPYTPHEVEVVRSLAGQAAVSIENGRLYRDIENLFAGFIEAAVTAIDQRDPTTAGHSVRVAELTCATAEVLDAQTDGPFADVRFDEERLKQLRYASLLHDFGKVGVREELLVKTNKLPPVMSARIEERFGLIRRTLEADAAREREAALLSGTPDAMDRLNEVDGRLRAELEELERYRAAIEEANVPRAVRTDPPSLLREMATKRYTAPDGSERPYLTEEELHFLSIPRGNLDENERRQIESHVMLGYDFLVTIPWTKELSHIHEIVRGHHERLDGTGYPDGVQGDVLTLETRIMTVCDIFDALTASDRPYQKALSVDEALDVLRAQAKEGALDAEIVDLFCRSSVYGRTLESDRRRP